MLTCRSWGCWSIAATNSAARRPRRSTGCIGCCWNCCPAGRNASSPRSRPALIATIRPRDIVGKTRRRLAVELIGELEASTRRSSRSTRTSPRSSSPAGRRCWSYTALARPGRHGCSPTSETSPGSPLVTGSLPGTAPRHWTPRRVSNWVTGSPTRATGASTGPCTSWRRPAAQPHRGPGLLRGKEGRGQDLDGGHARTQTTTVQCGLPADGA